MPQTTVDRHDLYINAYCNTLMAYADNPTLYEQDLKPIIKKLIVYGIKAVNAKKEPEYMTREEVEIDFRFADIILYLIGSLTPSEFMNLFPIAKEYKGRKWHIKDYFYTRDYIKSLNRDKPIGGQQEALKFIWEYANWEITEFNVKIMEYTSRLRELDGHPSLAEEWADMMGLKTYTMHTDSQGKEYLLDGETGKTIRIRPKRRLKLVR